MQYKMLNEVLEVAMALQPKGQNTLETLYKILNEANKYNELTPKQKRVLNCLQTVATAQQKRDGDNSRINV